MKDKIYIRRPEQHPRNGGYLPKSLKWLLFLLLCSALLFAVRHFFVSNPLSVMPGREKSHEPAIPKLSQEEKNYFASVYKDTWNYLATFVDGGTGLPYDSSAMQPVTSMSNVGLYMASVSIALRTGLLTHDEAAMRISRCLDSLEAVEKWRGIPRPWILVKTLKPAFGDMFDYGAHLSNLLAGLILTQSTFPEFNRRVRVMIGNMELKTLYDAKTGWLKGGFDMSTMNFATFQPWGYWYYKFYASETRLLSFYLLGTRAAPKEHWFSLARPTQTKEGETFFVSGYEEGGLIQQFLTGIFIDERSTPMGRSQKSYAQSQINHAKRIGVPVWGWSACESPQGRYLTFGLLKDDVVTPYASMMASIYFPGEAVKNLKALEKLGARPLGQMRLGNKSFGFRDSISLKNKDVARNYLTLSQAAGFLSLANLLHGGVVWKSFREDAIVQKSFEILASDY